jgi:hypothetical protein
VRLDSGGNVGEFRIVGAVGWRRVSGAGRCCGGSGRGGAARGVKYFRHLAVVDAVGVVTKGRVSVPVFEGFGFALAASVVLLARGQGSGGCGGVVIVKVPSRRGELVPGR